MAGGGREEGGREWADGRAGREKVKEEKRKVGEWSREIRK